MDAYLEITYRHGRPLAAYDHLPREEAATVARTSPRGSGLVVDFAESGAPMGIEIIDPDLLTVAAFNALLAELGLPPVDEAELAPLRAA